MIRNYFKTAWRNIVKNGSYSVINISGLAVGMAVAVLIGLWVYDEISFNRSHQNYASIAQVRRTYTDPATHETFGAETMHYPTAALLKKDYNQYFKHVVMASWLSDFNVMTPDIKVSRQGEFIEPEGLEMLSPKMIEGNYHSLDNMNSIVISKSLASALFGKISAMNKFLKIDYTIDVIVTGVYEDIASNSTYSDVQFFAPWSLWVTSNNWIAQNLDSWNNPLYQVLVQLGDHVSMESANAAIKGFYYKSIPGEVSTGMRERKFQALLYPMKDWHLYSDFRNGIPAGGRIVFVWLFETIAVFVLLLACINFINLNTARAEKRAKEVGIRKTMGSRNYQLIQQFLSESLLVVFIAFVVSLLLIIITRTWFNELSDKKINIPWSSPYFWLVNLLFITGTSLLAGAYPSFYLSSFQPVKVLRGAIRTGKLASLPRKTLVVIQFTVSIILIIGTIVVYKQVQFAQERPVGYQKEGLISISKDDREYDGKLNYLRDKLLQTDMTEGLETSSTPVTNESSNSSDFDWIGKSQREYSFAITSVSYGFGKLAHWEFTSGRDFSKDFLTDTSKIIINETAAKDMGLKNPIGQVVKTDGGSKSMQIIGVIKDIITGSPYEGVKRGIYFLDPDYERASDLLIRIKPTASAHAALVKIEEVFKNIIPSALFNYKFVDQQYALKFSQERRVGKLSVLFSTLAIFISCLGLFGLASFVAEQRSKEIAVRKVVGASTFNIWHLLSQEFTKPVFISLVSASPIAYLLMHNWVQKYTYHTGIPLWIFPVAGAAALLITLLTVSWQSFKAATMNPVTSLRQTE